MAQIVVRKLEEDVLLRVKERARRNGRSTEAEIRKIIKDSVEPVLSPPSLSELGNPSGGNLDPAGPAGSRPPLTSLIGAGSTKMTIAEINEYVRALRDEWTDRE